MIAVSEEIIADRKHAIEPVKLEGESAFAVCMCIALASKLASSLTSHIPLGARSFEGRDYGGLLSAGF